MTAAPPSPPPSRSRGAGAEPAGAERERRPAAGAGGHAELEPRWSLRLPRGRTLALGVHPRVMGVVNLTPDSFSDGGRLWSGEGGGRIDVERALDHARALLAEGATLLDLGAESTRPAGAVYGAGASAVPADEELRRLLPVLDRLRAETDVPLSVDTRKAEVARAALAAGADLVNDVEALADPALAETVAAAGCPVVLMHSRGDFASTMQHQARYADVLGEVRDELEAALARADATGVDRAQVVLDPGIGFAKGPRHNLLLLRRLDVLATLGRPLLVGASRKSFIGRITGAGPAERLPGSLAAVAWAARHGAAIVRVHDVAATVQFLAVLRAVESADEDAGGEETAGPEGVAGAPEGERAEVRR